MTTFYFQVEMTKSSGRYWTLGLKLVAESYTEALQMFKAWSNGIETMSSLTPYLRNFGDIATPNRSYFHLRFATTLREELTKFMHEDDESVTDGINLNWKQDLGDHNTDDDCPF